MHYSCFVFTKEFPTNEILQTVLRPFNENDYYENESEKEILPFMWDWFSIGGRYSGLLKLEVRQNDEKYEWQYYAETPRNNRLFRSSLIDMIDNFKKDSKDGWMFSEEKVYNELGYRDGYIRVDGCLVSDILNKKGLSCYCFIDKYGNGYSRETWNGKKWETNDNFEDIFKNTMKDSEDCYLCVVDLHD